jgi:regulator of protease activity HflC (stomatin/prohibitin superfamily)
MDYDRNTGTSKVLRKVALVACAAIAGLIAFLVLQVRTVPEAHAGVWVYKPYIFGKTYVDQTASLGPARNFAWISTEVVALRTSPQSVSVHAEDFMSSDRIPLDFDISITIEMTENAQGENGPKLWARFGQQPLAVFRTLVLQDADAGTAKSNVKGELMSYLRDQVRHHHSQEFISAQKEDGSISNAASDVEKHTVLHINKFLADNSAGMIRVTNIALGRANPPDGVRKAIEETATQAQNVKTQGERQKAETSRKAAEEARAAADQAYLLAMKMDADMFIQLRAIEMQRDVCARQGASCTFFMGGTPSPVTKAGK